MFEWLLLLCLYSLTKELVLNFEFCFMVVKDEKFHLHCCHLLFCCNCELGHSLHHHMFVIQMSNATPTFVIVFCYTQTCHGCVHGLHFPHVCDLFLFKLLFIIHCVAFYCHGHVIFIMFFMLCCAKKSSGMFVFMVLNHHVCGIHKV